MQGKKEEGVKACLPYWTAKVSKLRERKKDGDETLNVSDKGRGRDANGSPKPNR